MMAYHFDLSFLEFASEDFVRIKTKVVDGKVNKEIAGFYLPTD